MKKSKGRLLRWAKQAAWIIPLVGLIVFLNASHSFMAIGSGSMRPQLQVGDLVIITPTPTNELKVGDIVDYTVPVEFRKMYGYPSSVCHRIISIQQTANGLAFRTKGDNTSQDPFNVFPGDVRGKQTGKIRYIGFLVMFAQSKPGLYLLAGLLIISSLYNNSDNIAKGSKKVRGAVFGASAAELSNFQKEQQEQMRTMTGHVTSSMDQFSAAMAEYAKHLASHTAAVQSLAQAAQHLELVVTRQEANSNGGLQIINRQSTLEVENQKEAVDSALLIELETNLVIATAPWVNKLRSFQTECWDAKHGEYELLLTAHHQELTQLYFDISLANNIVGLATEIGHRSRELDESYIKLCSGIAENLKRLVPSLNDTVKEKTDLSVTRVMDSEHNTRNRDAQETNTVNSESKTNAGMFFN
jgi:signal peptidase I